MREWRRVAAIFLLVAVPWVRTSSLAGQEVQTATLELMVALVTSDLTVRPVPKARFAIVPSGSEGVGFELVTDFGGKGQILLPLCQRS